MRFAIIPALVALAAPLVAADQDNAFNIPTSGLNTGAGKTLDLKWNLTPGSGTVTLILRSGASSNLNTGAYIAKNIQNSGSYSWSVPSSITRGSDYTVEIVSDSDTTNTNYTPYFVIDSDNTVASSTGLITMGAPTAALPSNTNSMSSGSASSGSATASSGASSMTSGSMSSGSASSSMSSKSGSMTSMTSNSASTSDNAISTSSLGSTGAAAAMTMPAFVAGVAAIGAMVL